MAGDEVDACSRGAGAAEDVAAARNARGELRYLGRQSRPEPPGRVAIAVIPLGPCRREVPELVPARAKIPRLRDELAPLEAVILAELFEEPGCGGEEIRIAAHRGGQVEAKAIHMHLFDPVAEALDDDAANGRLREIHAVAGSGPVDAAARIFAIEAIPQ